MRRYLVVASHTLGGDRLPACVRERTRAGPSHFHVRVPATPASQLHQEYVASVPEHERIPSTVPGRGSRRLAGDLPSRVRRVRRLPETRVSGGLWARTGPKTTKE